MLSRERAQAGAWRPQTIPTIILDNHGWKLLSWRLSVTQVPKHSPLERSGSVALFSLAGVNGGQQEPCPLGQPLPATLSDVTAIMRANDICPPTPREAAAHEVGEPHASRHHHVPRADAPARRWRRRDPFRRPPLATGRGQGGLRRDRTPHGQGKPPPATLPRGGTCQPHLFQSQSPGAVDLKVGVILRVAGTGDPLGASTRRLAASTAFSGPWEAPSCRGGAVFSAQPGPRRARKRAHTRPQSVGPEPWLQLCIRHQPGRGQKRRQSGDISPERVAGPTRPPPAATGRQRGGRGGDRPPLANRPSRVWGGGGVFAGGARRCGGVRE